MILSDLFPNARPRDVTLGDPLLDFRAFVKAYNLVHVDHVEYSRPIFGEIGRVRYYARRYAAVGAGVAGEALLSLSVFSDASFGVYVRVPGDDLHGTLAKLGFDQAERPAAARFVVT